jgi:PPM family protein phosphatase
MLRVAEQYAGTDTGRQRRGNEDSLLARAPLFVIADGMGGARAGEVASRLAVESFTRGIDAAAEPERALARLVREANTRIYERSHERPEEAGMGTTLTALYVGEDEVSLAHVGDSRAYRMRDGRLERLTDDHSLVDEMIREGRLTPEEAFEHPQRSVITRALGNESDVDVDTFSVRALPGDVYLLCSDGLTDMVGEEELTRLLRKRVSRLRDVGEELIGAANEAGGRDNITVVLVRVEDVHAPSAGARTGPDAQGDSETVEAAALAAPAEGAAGDEGAAAAGAFGEAGHEGEERSGDARDQPRARVPRPPRARRAAEVEPAPQRSRKRRRAVVLAVLAVVLALIATGAYVASQSVYFIGTNSRGLVTLFRGVPVRLPGGIVLYQSDYVTGVSASTLAPGRRGELLDHSLRSESNAIALLRSLELGQLE